MTKTEFNKIFDNYLHQILKEKGFKKLGIHYYLHDSQKIMLIKNGSRVSHDILVCFSIDSISNFRKENNKLKISPFLSGFQISIPTQVLKHQYQQFQTVKEFKYDLNFMTRESLTTRNRVPTDIGLFISQFQMPTKLNEAHIESAIKVIVYEGLKLKDEFDSSIAYLALDKYPDELLDMKMLTMKKEIKAQLISEEKPIPQYKNNLIEEWRISRHLKKMRRIKKSTKVYR